MYPAKWFFRKHEEEPTTEVAIRRSISEDLYIVMPAFDLKDQSASLHVVINPLVELDLVRVRHHRAGHGHRAAAGARPTASPSPGCRPEAADDHDDRCSAADRRRAARRLLRAQHSESGTTVPVVARTPARADDAEAS